MHMLVSVMTSRACTPLVAVNNNGIAGMEDDISSGGFSLSADSRLPLDSRKLRCAAGNRLRHMGHVGLQSSMRPNHATQQ